MVVCQVGQGFAGQRHPPRKNRLGARDKRVWDGCWKKRQKTKRGSQTVELYSVYGNREGTVWDPSRGCAERG